MIHLFPLSSHLFYCIDDRHWALVSADYKTLINYKQETKLSILRPLVKDGQLTITCPEVEPLHVTISEVTRNGKPITAGYVEPDVDIVYHKQLLPGFCRNK